MQKSINSVMINVYREENISPDNVFFAFLCCLHHNMLFHQSCVPRKQRMEILGVSLKRNGVYSSDQGKIMSVFDFGIFNGFN